MSVDIGLVKELFRSLSTDEHKGDVNNTLQVFAPRFGLEMYWSDVREQMVFDDEVYCSGCGLSKDEADEYYDGGCECDDEVFKPITVENE